MLCTVSQALYELEGHDAPVTAAAFCDHAPHQLVSTSEDRTFKVWDLSQRCLVYQSAVLCAAPPTCLALDPSFPRCGEKGAPLVMHLSVVPNVVVGARRLPGADMAASIPRLYACIWRKQPDRLATGAANSVPHFLQSARPAMPCPSHHHRPKLIRTAVIPATLQSRHRLAIGAADGVVRFFDLSGLPACRPLQTVDLSKALQRISDAAASCFDPDAGRAGPRVISSRPGWQQPAAAQPATQVRCDECTRDGAMLVCICVGAMLFCTRSKVHAHLSCP